MSQPFIGEIRMFAGNFAPAGWAFCDGSLQVISQNDALFNLIGTTYGGDGQTTFALPNLSSRLPLHMGTDPGSGTTYNLAATGGTETVTLTAPQLPAHNHPVNAATAATSADPAGNVPAGGSVKQFSTQAPDVQMNPAQVQAGGAAQPHYNMQPYLAINFIISLFGVFPSAT
jgi:microcystin-dependent protein